MSMSTSSPPPPAPPRRPYSEIGLTEADAGTDPFALFDRWFTQAREADLPQPEAMALSTVHGSDHSDGTDGRHRPTTRMVLLKEFSPAGFTFYTNYGGAKSHELGTNPSACLLFFWSAHERQVRIEGHTVRVADEESDAYFATRPRDSQLGAWASPQSEIIEERAVLERRFAYEAARFEGITVPRPPHWGGFRVVPDRIEFWQGRRSRLHDRLRFVRSDGPTPWYVERLAP